MIFNPTLKQPSRTQQPVGEKHRPIAVALALAGAALPVSGFHKFYLGQPWWGLSYLILSWTPIPRIASLIEAVWYLAQERVEFDRNFNPNFNPSVHGSSVDPASPARPSMAIDPTLPDRTLAVAQALRELDRLREEGLISELEFEQKRRSLLDCVG